jgi:hypothetical protein
LLGIALRATRNLETIASNSTTTDFMISTMLEISQQLSIAAKLERGLIIFVA